MVHPSSQAVDYVYDIFCRSLMSGDTIAMADRWGKLTRRMEHRHATPQAAASFRVETIALARQLAGGNDDLFQRFISLTQ